VATKYLFLQAGHRNEELTKYEESFAAGVILKNFRPETPPSVDRPIFLLQAWFHHEVK